MQEYKQKETVIEIRKYFSTLNTPFSKNINHFHISYIEKNALRKMKTNFIPMHNHFTSRNVYLWIVVTYFSYTVYIDVGQYTSIPWMFKKGKPKFKKKENIFWWNVNLNGCTAIISYFKGQGLQIFIFFIHSTYALSGSPAYSWIFFHKLTALVLC